MNPIIAVLLQSPRDIAFGEGHTLFTVATWLWVAAVIGFVLVSTVRFKSR